jgi:hypothetical protein
MGVVGVLLPRDPTLKFASVTTAGATACEPTGFCDLLSCFRNQQSLDTPLEHPSVAVATSVEVSIRLLLPRKRILYLCSALIQGSHMGSV